MIWDDESIAIIRDVAGQQLHSKVALREIARRLGVERVTDDQIRNVLRRRDLPLQYAATGRPPRRDEEPTDDLREVARLTTQSGGADSAGPETERSRRGSDAPSSALSGGNAEPAMHRKTGVERILLLPDCHFPFIDRQAWNCMLAAARDFKPDTIAQLGDFVDCYSVSSHDKNPNRRERLVDEIEAANDALDELDALGATRRLMVVGNHTQRLEKLISTKAPGLHGLVSMKALLRFDERGWEVYPYRRTAKIGSLSIVHDVGEAGRYAAMRARDAYEGDVVIGHVHQMSVSYSGSAKSDMHVGACLGWLGAPVAAEDYMAEQKIRRQWMTGFGVAYRDRETDKVVIVPVPIFGGRCIVEGKVYTAPRVHSEAA